LVAAAGNDQILRTTIENYFSKEGSTLIGDARLDNYVAWLLERVDRLEKMPSHRALDFVLRQFGLVEPLPHIIVLGIEPKKKIELEVKKELANLSPNDIYTHYGSAVRQCRGRSTCIALALSKRNIALDSLARSYDSQSNLRLKGALKKPFSQPALVVTQPSGKVISGKKLKGQKFDFSFKVKTPGEYRFEILGSGPFGPAPVANFPVYVGMEVPTSYLEEVADRDADSTDDRESIRRSILQLINGARAKAGLPHLERHPAAEAVAQAHCEDMHENNFVGHVSPTSGTPSQRLARAGIKTFTVEENIGASDTPRGVHEGLMASPGHRAAILSKYATNVGIGVVKRKFGSDQDLLVTELFLKKNQKQNMKDVFFQALQLIGKLRKENGLGELKNEKILNQVARQAAQEYFKNPKVSIKALYKKTNQRLNALWKKPAGFGVLITPLVDLSQLAEIEKFFDPKLNLIGVGVAQGMRPDTPPNTIVVVLIIGWPLK
jgi:uncharacterized protein YkwD